MYQGARRGDRRAADRRVEQRHHIWWLPGHDLRGAAPAPCAHAWWG